MSRLGHPNIGTPDRARAHATRARFAHAGELDHAPRQPLGLRAVKREPTRDLALQVPESVRLAQEARVRVRAAAAMPACALAVEGTRGRRAAPTPPVHAGASVPQAAATRVAAPLVALAPPPPGTAGPDVAVPDGRRTQAAEAKRADNRRRATATGLIEEPLAFFNAGVLGDGASDQQRDLADALLQRARQRTERAHHASKDNRLGTALSKYEALCEILPDLRKFQGLEYEGDLNTSQRNEILLITIAEYIRERPKSSGGLVQGDTVGGQISAIKKCVEDHLNRPIIAPTAGLQLKAMLRQCRFEDGPSGERKYLAALRAAHLAQLVDRDCGFDYTSAGWPTARWALLLIMHQCLLRGGEPGRVAREPFRPALGLCWSHFVWIDPLTNHAATVRDKVTGRLHWRLTVLVRSIKDTNGRLRRVPIVVTSKYPMDVPLGDPTCPYSAVRRLWRQREGQVPAAERASTPFFLGPGGLQAVNTDEARDAIRAAATALQLDPGQFGGSACRRGGATDLRDQHGYEAAKQLVIDRGRWCTSDIADIYARASLEEHAAASVGLALAGQGVSLEEANPGWVQPRGWRST